MNAVWIFIISWIVISLVTLLGTCTLLHLGKRFWPEWLERYIAAPDPNPEPAREWVW